MTLTFDLYLTLTLDFQDQIFQLLYLRKGLSAWHDMMLAAQYDFDLGYRSSCISGMDGSCFIWNICTDVNEID